MKSKSCGIQLIGFDSKSNEVHIEVTIESGENSLRGTMWLSEEFVQSMMDQFKKHKC